MRTEDAKRHIYHTKKPLKAEDVRKIIAAIKKAGRITKDRTGEGVVRHIWRGVPPFPKLPEDSRLTLLLEDQGTVKCALAGSVSVGPAETKKPATWTALSKAVEASDFKEENNVCATTFKLAKQPQISSIYFVVYLGANPKKVVIRLSPKSGASTSVKLELLTDLLIPGSWPVSLETKGEDLTGRSTAGGSAEWNNKDNRLSFTIPGVSNEQAVASLAKSVCNSKHSFDLMCHLNPPKAAHSWKGFNAYLRQLEKVATPKMELNLLGLSWRPSGYESFEAMAGMIEAFPEDDQLLSRMFEFEFAGQLGFMELAAEAKGFRPWFSFDVETPFPELQKVIGFPLMEMQ